MQVRELPMASIRPAQHCGASRQVQRVCQGVRCVQFTVTEALEGLVLPGTAYVLLGKAGAVLVMVICFMCAACRPAGLPSMGWLGLMLPECALAECLTSMSRASRLLQEHEQRCGPDVALCRADRLAALQGRHQQRCQRDGGRRALRGAAAGPSSIRWAPRLSTCGAVSSLFTFDIYRQYINPKVTPRACQWCGPSAASSASSCQQLHSRPCARAALAASGHSLT